MRVAALQLLLALLACPCVVVGLEVTASARASRTVRVPPPNAQERQAIDCSSAAPSAPSSTYVVVLRLQR